MTTTTPLTHLITDWQTTRQALRALEESEHPDITDKFGRVWVWKDKDLYTHDGMAWTRQMIESPHTGLPTKNALDNPNYQWCSICRSGQAQVSAVTS